MIRWLAVILLSACGGLDYDIEDQVTIDQGAYGLLATGHEQLGTGIGVTVELPPLAGAVHGSSLDAATTTSDGIYQFELPPGSYQICTDSCIPVEVPDQGRVRHDWISGAWCDGRC